MEAADSIDSPELRFRTLQCAVDGYVRSIHESWWTPAEDEALVRHVIPGWTFPWKSLPPERDLADGCDAYQHARPPEFPMASAPSDDAPVSEKIAYLERHIRAIGNRRGQDLCHETDGIAQLSKTMKDVENRLLNAPMSLRCQLCAWYRQVLYGGGKRQ